MIPSYLRGASIIFLVYDLTWRESFEAIKSWLGFVNQYTSKDQVKLVLVGNKCDLERKVKSEEGKKLAEKEGMLFFETSAKTADGVVDMFFTSFSMIDFFDNIRKGNVDENLVKQLIEQNMVNIDKKEDKNKFKNDIIKNVNNDDDMSKNDFLKNKNDKDKGNKNNKDDNIIQIKIERNSDKNQKKKCNC